MPKLSAKEIEEQDELLEQKKPKKVTKVTIWFDDNCVENRSDIVKVCDLTARSLDESFGMYARSNNNEVYAVIFFATFVSILKYIASKQKTYKNYSIQIFNSINIGYTNNDDEDNEKVGNFMPVFEYVGVNNNVVKEPDEKVDSHEMKNKFMLWKSINSKKNVEHYKEIQEIAFEKLLNEFKVDLRFSECILPIFCIFFDHVIAVLKLKYRELEGTDTNEVKMNVLGLFDVYYYYDEEDSVDVITFEPNITSKLILKNDGKATTLED